MKLGFKYGTRDVYFNLIYRNRKTMSIEVEANGEVNVISPTGYDKDVVLEKVKLKANWIIQKQYEVAPINNQKIEREAVSGESYMYLGRNYSLDIILGESVKEIEVKLYRGKFAVRTYTKDEYIIKNALELWYREKTLEQVKERVEYYQGYFKENVKEIKVKEQKKRWASCTARNILLFNWRCVMAKSSVLDYIVVHELCHMEYKDHSKAFWDRVGSIMPDYEVRKQWLKENGIKLDL